MAQVFNIPRILAAIQAAEYAALEVIAVAVVADARSRAPIRKVFKEPAGFRRKFRSLSGAEKSLATKRANAYYLNRGDEFGRRRAVGHIRNYAKAQVPRRGSNNSLTASRSLRTLGTLRGRQFTPHTDATRIVSRRTGAAGYDSATLNPLLTSRGRYEVRSGRAIHLVKTASGASKVQIGGALKASIESEGVVQTGHGAQVKVTAGIRYAKYVEFPTIRTAAQPFLLPALHGQRQKLVKVLGAEVGKALGG